RIAVTTIKTTPSPRRVQASRSSSPLELIPPVSASDDSSLPFHPKPKRKGVVDLAKTAPEPTSFINIHDVTTPSRSTPHQYMPQFETSKDTLSGDSDHHAGADKYNPYWFYCHLNKGFALKGIMDSLSSGGLEHSCFYVDETGIRLNDAD